MFNMSMYNIKYDFSISKWQNLVQNKKYIYTRTIYYCTVWLKILLVIWHRSCLCLIKSLV